MAHPAAFLHALSLPSVTNGRASGDYQTPTSNLYSYGTSAPFFAAVDIAPSKDNFWTTPNQPRPRDLTPSGGPPPCDGGSRNVTDNFLHALVATLSTGPVGFSDALGYTNASLVRSTCAASGLLLKPSLPLAAIDRSFSRRTHDSRQPSGRVFGGPPVPPSSHVWATHTAVQQPGDQHVFYFAVSLGQGGHPLEPFGLVRSDLWPPLADDRDVVVWHFGDPSSAHVVPGSSGVNDSMITTAVNAKNTTNGGRGATTGGDSLLLANLTGNGFAYVIVAPVLTGGWALLGELTKLTPVSVQRNFSFSVVGNSASSSSIATPTTTPTTTDDDEKDDMDDVAVADATSRLIVSLSGTPGEAITLAARSATGEVLTTNVTVDGQGRGTATFATAVKKPAA